MPKIAVFIADGTEETEAIAPTDLMRRAKLDVTTVSVMGRENIVSSHGISIEADTTIEKINFEDFDMLVLPGGLKGTANLKANQTLADQIKKFNEEGKGLAAICAAPSVFSGLGILKGIPATCNPSFFDVLKADGADLKPDEKVVVSNNIITSQAMGTSIPFGLAIVAYFQGRDAAEALKSNIVF